VNHKQVLSEREVSAEYSLGVPWLRKARRLGRGPVFLRIGRMIRYQREDIEAFLLDHMILTKESGKGE
jgi:hypothetical protein